MIVFNDNTMKTKNKKLLKTFDSGETTVYQVCYRCAIRRSVYFNEKPNKKQLINIAEKYFKITSEEEIAQIDENFSVIEFKVFNLYSPQ
jgi:hypothetical protein